MFNYKKKGYLIKCYCSGLCEQCVNLHANNCVLTELIVTIRLITGCTFLTFMIGYVK